MADRFGGLRLREGMLWRARIIMDFRLLFPLFLLLPFVLFFFFLIT